MKISNEMRRVLYNIANTSWGMCGTSSTRRALVRRGLANEVRDDQGRIHYEVSVAGAALLAQKGATS